MCCPSRGGDVVPVEIAQPQRLRLDVERAAPGNEVLLGARPNAIVPHVADAAQNHALREPSGTVAVAGAELPQDRDQRVPDQRVDLVDDQDRRRGVMLRPTRENPAEYAVGPDRRIRGFGQRGGLGIAERATQLLGQSVENGAHGLTHVLARRLPRLDVDMDAAVMPGRSAVQQVAQRQKSGGLTRLPRRVQDEVAPPSNQRQDLRQIDPAERRYAVVLVGADRTRRVEIAHGGNFARAVGASNRACAKIAVLAEPREVHGRDDPVVSDRQGELFTVAHGRRG